MVTKSTLNFLHPFEHLLSHWGLIDLRKNNPCLTDHVESTLNRNIKSVWNNNNLKRDKNGGFRISTWYLHNR
jgi:hypothetical protein